MSEQNKFLTAPQVQQRYGITHMTLWRWLHNPALRFPRPTTINRRRYFSESEIIAWERDRAREQSAA